MVKAKKYLGQHFLKDENIAQQIGAILKGVSYEHILEIGPGTGILTKYLLQKNKHLTVIEIDRDCVTYMQEVFLFQNKKKLNPSKSFTILEADFLEQDLSALFQKQPFAICGNFPYHISSQIIFKALENKHLIPELFGMFQKEVAQRICQKQGSKTYGILSVLVQAYYEAEYLFDVPPQVFIPPPKIISGVLRLQRKAKYILDCDEKLFKNIVKTAFNQRRKTLRNSLKEDIIFDCRPEQLSVDAFIDLTHKINNDSI